MPSEMSKYWREPGYWRWWFRTRMTTDTKIVLAIVAATAIAAGGFVSARKLDDTQATHGVLTVVRTTRGVGRAAQVVTEVQTIRQPAETDVVTLQRNGRTVTVRAPGEAIVRERTVRGAVRQQTVTDTVAQTRTRDRVRTVTTPGAIVTTPGATMTTPERVVTAPGTTVTETAPAKTVTNEYTVTREVTQPAVTVTQTNEVTVTAEVTVTETVTK
jgi:hypothetical protein